MEVSSLSTQENRKNHCVFVIDVDGNPLTPTTWGKAKKMIKDGVAKIIWSKLNIPGIRMKIQTRKETPPSSIGIDIGAKFEGYSVVVGNENSINIKLDLPNKEFISKKMKQRKDIRHNRRLRKTRKRVLKTNLTVKKDFIAPSQKSLLQSRIKLLTTLIHMYPIKICGLENVKFNHYKNRYGKYFSSCEIGKNILRKFIKTNKIDIVEYCGWETKNIRESFCYLKSQSKSKNVFESHCSDSLSLALDSLKIKRITPGKLIHVDDNYRPVRRKLHDFNFRKNGKRDKYSTGVVNKLRKGLLIGTKDNRKGRLVVINIRNKIIYYFFINEKTNKRTTCNSESLSFVSSNYITKEIK